MRPNPLMPTRMLISRCSWWSMVEAGRRWKWAAPHLSSWSGPPSPPGRDVDSPHQRGQRRTEPLGIVEEAAIAGHLRMDDGQLVRPRRHHGARVAHPEVRADSVPLQRGDVSGDVVAIDRKRDV